MGTDNFHRFADGRPGGDHVIHQHHTALQWAAYQRAAFAMFLGFLTVEAIRHIEIVMFCQCHCGGGRNRNTFVGWAKQQIELDAGIHQRFGIKTP
jgi:hypothetical protein